MATTSYSVHVTVIIPFGYGYGYYIILTMTRSSYYSYRAIGDRIWRLQWTTLSPRSLSMYWTQTVHSLQNEYNLLVGLKMYSSPVLTSDYQPHCNSRAIITRSIKLTLIAEPIEFWMLPFIRRISCNQFSGQYVKVQLLISEINNNIA